jgi:WD40 repeat protein
MVSYRFVRQEHLFVLLDWPFRRAKVETGIYKRDGKTWPKRFTAQLESNPEALQFLPDSSYLVYSRREDYRLNYISLTEGFVTISYNLNERQDAHVSFTIMHIARHPTQPVLSLQTDSNQSQIFLVPYESAERLATLYTSASHSEYSTPRHAWFSDGSAIAINSDDGLLWAVSPLDGRTIQCVRAHGIADAELAQLASKEELRARIQKDKGSSNIKDVCVFTSEGTGPVIATCSYDRTIRLTHCTIRQNVE